MIGTFSRLIGICFGATLVLAGVAVLAPEVYASIFTSTELVELTSQVMPVYFMGLTIFGIQSACQSTFLALGVEQKVSVLIALLRKVILLIPLAILLPKWMGVMEFYRAEPIADVTSVVVTSILFILQ